MRGHTLNRSRSTLLLVALAALVAGGPAHAVARVTLSPALKIGVQAEAFAHAAFERMWNRTDRPVSLGQVARSYYWGPQPNTGGLQEDYAEGAGGKRLVQYFDKSRMEINNPNTNPNDPFFVTNGLLTVELISGRMQVGNNSYVTRQPANIPLASDTDDSNAPTYASFQGVSNTTLGDHPSPDRTGQLAIVTISRTGQTGENPLMIDYPGTNLVYFDSTTHHNIPKAIWDFLNQSGPVYDPNSGQAVNARLSDPWFYATGLPISEPYWAKVKIANQPNQDVLIQAFERRVVTYVPGAPASFRVQMGNIGQHYHDWRYSAAPPPTAPPAPTTSPAPAATPTQGPAPRPASDFAGTWLNNETESGSVAKLWISSAEANSLTVQWFDPCGESLCDKEEKTAAYSGEPFNITLNNHTFGLSFLDPDGGDLQVVFDVTKSFKFHRVLPRDYFGTWLNDDPAATNVGKLWITNGPAELSVRWFGVCTPAFCSNAEETNDYNGEPFHVTIDGHPFTITCDNTECSELAVQFDNKHLRFHRVRASSFNGTWNNMDPGTAGPVKFIITSPVKIHWYSACTPAPCDNGTISGQFNTEPLVADAAGSPPQQFTITFENAAATRLKVVVTSPGQPSHMYYFQKQ